MIGHLRRNSLSIKILKKFILLDVETGTIFWKDRVLEDFPSKKTWLSFQSRFAGKRCGTYKAPDGYYRVTVNKTVQLVHRIIWALYYGEWPAKQLDHIDGDTTNNKISNLREVTGQQNQANSKSTKGSSIYKGVHWCNTSKRWVAKLMFNYKNVFTKHCNTEEEAAIAYNEAAKFWFGKYSKQNMIKELDDKGEKIKWKPPEKIVVSA